MTNPADILYELEQAQRNYAGMHERTEEIAAKRNEMIRAALAAGVKQADIARLTGLSRARIAQLR